MIKALGFRPSRHMLRFEIRLVHLCRRLKQFVSAEEVPCSLGVSLVQQALELVDRFHLDVR